MARLLAFATTDVPTAPSATVIDFRRARSEILRRGRQDIAIERALQQVFDSFPDIRWHERPEDISAAVALALELVSSNPDFAELREGVV